MGSWQRIATLQLRQEEEEERERKRTKGDGLMGKI